MFSKGRFSGFAGNLGAGFVRSVLTVFLIDRAIEGAQQQQSRRVRVAAFERLRPKVVSHLIFLFDLHKASATTAPGVGPTKLDDLFTLSIAIRAAVPDPTNAATSQKNRILVLARN